MAPFTSNGFELDVEVKFVDDGSLEYARNPRDCRFEIREVFNSPVSHLNLRLCSKVFKIGNDSPPHLSPKLHSNLQI